MDYEYIKVVERNETWSVQCSTQHKQVLFKKDGTPKKEVEELAKAIRMFGMGWDIVYYKSIVAFKNPCERITWIYPKRYFDGRMRDSYKRLDVVKLDAGTVQKILNKEITYETGFPAY
ncbi:MAG: hypothetical protein J6D33_02930 [Turicibacter sp.]|nr:hypothetical protein [Turicibacter sp.]